jgi:hypothetical protein
MVNTADLPLAFLQVWCGQLRGCHRPLLLSLLPSCLRMLCDSAQGLRA